MKFNLTHFLNNRVKTNDKIPPFFCRLSTGMIAHLNVGIVVSIGVNHTFKVHWSMFGLWQKTPLFWFGISAFSSCVINTCFVLFKRKEWPQQINSAFLNAQGRLIHRCLRVKSNNGKS